MGSLGLHRFLHYVSSLTCAMWSSRALGEEERELVPNSLKLCEDMSGRRGSITNQEAYIVPILLVTPALRYRG